MVDCSPVTVLDRFDRLCSVLTMSSDRRSRLQLARPRVADAVAVLAESALPVTWQHGDLHPGNTYLTPDRPVESMRLFDFGDSQWAHALEALVVPFGIVTQASIPWEPVLEAYADVWGSTVADLSVDWSAVALTHAVNRSLTWWGCLSEATAAEWAEWEDALVSTLARVVDA